MDEDICKHYCYREQQAKNTPRIKQDGNIEFIAFDMDGVLADIRSSWRWIHEYFNADNEASVRAFLRGEIDDEEFVRRDIALWKQNGMLITKQELEEIIHEVPLMPGAEKCFAELHKMGITTAIVSAGLDTLAYMIAEQLGIDEVVANCVDSDGNGRLTGEGTVCVRLREKGEPLRQLLRRQSIPPGRCAAVGNSCFDISMFEACGLGIAFNPDDACVEQEADIVIKEKNLCRILDHV